MEKKMKDYYCLDCNVLLEQLIPGVISGSLRTDGNKDIVKAVPGGVIYGKKLGFVCCECSIIGKEERK